MHLKIICILVKYSLLAAI